MTRLCDGYSALHACPRRNPCEGDCHFNTAGLDGDLVTFNRTAHIDEKMCVPLRIPATIAVLLTFIFVCWFTFFVAIVIQLCG